MEGFWSYSRKIASSTTSSGVCCKMEKKKRNLAIFLIAYTKRGSLAHTKTIIPLGIVAHGMIIPDFAAGTSLALIFPFIYNTLSWTNCLSYHEHFKWLLITLLEIYREYSSIKHTKYPGKHLQTLGPMHWPLPEQLCKSWQWNWEQSLPIHPG